MVDLSALRRCARPVFFETGLADAPFSVCGTAFLVRYGRSVYVVTARHVVGDHPAEHLHIRAGERSKDRLPSTRWFDLPRNEDTDLSDLFLMRVSLDQLPAGGRCAAVLLNVKSRTTDWLTFAGSSTFFLFGYPAAPAHVDYDESTADTFQYFFMATYRGPSISRNCHELQIANPLKVADLNGLSGSPVFSCRRDLYPNELPMFTGMLLRGTAVSERVHFLSATRITDALDAAEEQFAD